MSSATFDLSFTVGSFIDRGYSVVILPPKGYAPNSVNMSGDWSVPDTPTSLSPIGPSTWAGQVTTKDGDAYNTWQFEVHRALNIVGTGQFVLAWNSGAVTINTDSSWVLSARLGSTNILHNPVKATSGTVTVTIGATA